MLFHLPLARALTFGPRLHFFSSATLSQRATPPQPRRLFPSATTQVTHPFILSPVRTAAVEPIIVRASSKLFVGVGQDSTARRRLRVLLKGATGPSGFPAATTHGRLP